MQAKAEASCSNAVLSGSCMIVSTATPGRAAGSVTLQHSTGPVQQLSIEVTAHEFKRNILGRDPSCGQELQIWAPLLLSYSSKQMAPAKHSTMLTPANVTKPL